MDDNNGPPAETGATPPRSSKRHKATSGKGASTKHTPTTEDLIIDAVRNGCTLRLAAKAAGISYETLRKWLRAADDGDERYVAFAQRFYMAEAKAAQTSFGIVQASEEWRAHAWILEHRFPDDYAAKQRTEVSGPEGGPIEVNSTALEKAAQELKAWQKTMATSLSDLLTAPPDP